MVNAMYLFVKPSAARSVTWPEDTGGFSYPQRQFADRPPVLLFSTCSSPFSAPLCFHSAPFSRFLIALIAHLYLRSPRCFHLSVIKLSNRWACHPPQSGKRDLHGQNEVQIVLTVHTFSQDKHGETPSAWLRSLLSVVMALGFLADRLAGWLGAVTSCWVARWLLTGCWLAVPAAISSCQAGWRLTLIGPRPPSGTECLAVMESVCDPDKRQASSDHFSSHRHRLIDKHDAFDCSPLYQLRN